MDDTSPENITDKNQTNMDESFSDTELEHSAALPQENNTPPNFAASRFKRRRDDDFSADINSLRKEMKDMFSTMLQKQAREFEKHTVVLNEIKQSNSNIESSVAFLTAQNEELKKKVGSLEEKVKEDNKYIKLLEERLEIMQQDNRKTNFEMKNVPKKQNETKEDLVNMVLCLSNTVGCNVDKSAIRDIYRVRGKKDTNNNTPIIVETNSTLFKNDILKACKAYNIRQKSKLCAKNLGMRTQEDTPIFVSEQLTPKAARLHFLARDLVRAKQYKYCWTAYGRVYLRKEDNSPIILIKSESQTQQLIMEK